MGRLKRSFSVCALYIYLADTQLIGIMSINIGELGREYNKSIIK